MAELDSDPQLLCVSRANFASHLTVLAHETRPAALEHVARTANGGPPAVAITFDDGYADNLHAAKPELEERQLPATVFVTAGQVGSRLEFWWDELERILLRPGRLPRALRLTIGGTPRSWDLGVAAMYTDGDARRHCGWTVLETADPTPRHAAYRDLCARLRPLGSDERHRVLAELAEQSDCAQDGRASHRAATAAELAELTHGGLVTLGAHTMTHPSLAARPLEEQRVEIEGGKRRLEDLLGKTISAFSYPFGTAGDYTRETVGLVAEAGFALACVNVPRRLPRRPRLLELPRFLVRNWAADEFEQRLREWLKG